MNKNTQLIDELYKKPKKDKGDNAPTFRSYPPNKIHQADILFMPDDGGFKYALVVADVGTRLCDAEPIKDKSSRMVSNAFQKIYKRKILSHPEVIQTDNGTEFQGDTQKYFQDHDISHRVGKPYRSRQQGIVERKNQLIGKALFKRMTEQELLTGETSREWVEDLPNVIKKMNDVTKKHKLPQPTDNYKCQGDACNILEQGTQVRIALDKPIDVVSGKRLNGSFRDTDVRWTIKPHTITSTLIQPDQPPLYLVDNKNDVAYTKAQLLPVKKSEQPPRAEAIRARTNDGKKLYTVESLLEKKKIKNKIYFLVKWKGFTDAHNTYEPRTTLIKDIPEMIKEFESKK